MSPEGQFICFLIALIFFAIAAVIRIFNKAWDSALVAGGLAVAMFVLVVNAAEVM